MQAYLNNPALKIFVLGQLAEHREADRLIKGTYWKNGKGCAVGCTLESVRWFNGHDGRDINHESHTLYEPELGIPRILAQLEDRFFEALDNGRSQVWPERFSSAIQVGADLTMIWPRWALWLLTEELPPRAAKHPRSAATLAEIGGLYREWTEGTKPAVGRWEKARKNAAAAYDASAYASAHAAADAAAAAAAYDASASAYAAADAAADADADAYAFAREKYYIRASDKLIELLEAA